MLSKVYQDFMAIFLRNIFVIFIEMQLYVH